MSAFPTTSGSQKQHFNEMVASAVARIKNEIKPNHGDYQRFFKRRGEFDDGFVALVSRLMAALPDYTLAKSILGGDFITAEEIMVARPDVVYSPEQIAQLAATIPSGETLALLKGYGYGLMPQPPQTRSLLEIRASKPDHFSTKTGGWYENQEFAKKNNRLGAVWLAVKKTPVNGSTSKIWDEQNKLLTEAEYVPNAAETSWFITIFFDVRGVRLFENVHIRTSNIGSRGGRVVVGNVAEGLHIYYYWDDIRHDSLGLASARKF